MAQSRMFNKTVICSDAFVTMPFSSQVMYIQLSMAADDEGFVNNEVSVMRAAGCSAGDIEELIKLGFVRKLKEGLLIVIHWHINNKIRQDRKQATAFQDYLDEDIKLGKDGKYYFDNQLSTNCQPDDNQMTTKCTARIVEERIGENSTEENSTEENVSAAFFSSSLISEKIFSLLKNAELPCDGSFDLFTKRSFHSALKLLHERNYSEDSVISAVQNYCQVIALQKEGKTWWNNKSDFSCFVKSGIIEKFLPENFNIENFKLNKSVKSDYIYEVNQQNLANY